MLSMFSFNSLVWYGFIKFMYLSLRVPFQALLRYWGEFGDIPLLPRTKLNVVVQVKPWLYLKTLIDCWYIGHTKGQKRVTFPLSLIESVNQSSKFWIKICGFHAQVFDWFSRVFHCLFTGFSRSFHALFTLWVWSGICLKLWSPVYIYILFYTSTHWVW